MPMISSGTTSVQALAPGSDRRVILCNTDANAAYVLIGSGTASATNLSFVLVQNDNAELNCDEAIQVVWAADGTGHLAVTTLSNE